MPTYQVLYETTMYHEVFIEADSEEQAKQITEEECMGEGKPYEISSDITSVTLLEDK